MEPSVFKFYFMMVQFTDLLPFPLFLVFYFVEAGLSSRDLVLTPQCVGLVCDSVFGLSQLLLISLNMCFS